MPPARVVRAVTDADLDWKNMGTQEYQALVGRCTRGLREAEPLREIEAGRPRLKGVTDLETLRQARLPDEARAAGART